MVLDVALRQTEKPAGWGLKRYLGKLKGAEDEENEKVVVLLHGITGNTRCYYMQLMVDKLIQNGFNVVAVNHYGVKNTKDCRLMNFSKQKYMDEVIKYASDRFCSQNSKNKCEVYLIGYSLGGNHVLRY